MGVVLALIFIAEINPIRVSWCCIRHLFSVTVITNSCTWVTRESASVIKVGVAYVNMCISRHLTEELDWAIDKKLWISGLFKNSYTTKNIKNKAILNIKQYCMHCYVTLNNIIELMHMETCIHYSTKNLLASYKVCLCLLLYYNNYHCTVWLFNFVGIKCSLISIHGNLWRFI